MDISQMDYLVFQFINDGALTFPGLNSFMQFLSEKAEYLFYLGIIFYWFTRIHQNRQMVITALLSACVAFGIGSVLSHLFYRDRPFIQHTVNQLIEHSANASFPSDHSIGAFVIATAIWLFRKKDGIIWLILAAMVSFSRVWNGVHYPSDVITGALIAVISSIMIDQIILRWSVAHQCVNVGIDLYVKFEKKFGVSFKKDKSSKLDN